MINMFRIAIQIFGIRIKRLPLAFMRAIYYNIPFILEYTATKMLKKSIQYELSIYLLW